MSVVAGAACAVTKINVTQKGSYVYWLTYKNALDESETTLPEAFKGKGTEMTPPVKFSNAKLFVMNKETGNTAIVDYAAPKDEKSAKPIDLKADDFQYVRNVRLKVVSEDGAPVERAIVHITDGMGTDMSAVVTPADQGVASFDNVATGEITVKVDADGLRKTIDSDVKLSEKRKTSGFERDIKVSGDVDTLPIEAASTGAAKEKPESKPGAGAYILPTVVGLVFLVIIGAVFYAIFKSKGITAGDALKKIGVDLPSDQPMTQPAPDAQPVIDPSVCQFCGQKKDASGNCACTIAPGASPFGASVQSGGGPRLIGTQGAYAGQVLSIPAGDAVIGREATNQIALTSDSTASRRHATITSANGEYTIRDEGSSNGTFVNGARITEQKLTPGDEIQIGGSKFRFEL
ncbi:MAG: FHA domain-containing protein [Armatimonadota bacterium]